MQRASLFACLRFTPIIFANVLYKWYSPVKERVDAIKLLVKYGRGF